MQMKAGMPDQKNGLHPEGHIADLNQPGPIQNTAASSANQTFD